MGVYEGPAVIEGAVKALACGGGVLMSLGVSVSTVMKVISFKLVDYEDNLHRSTEASYEGG